MSDQRIDEEAIFNVARQLRSPEARATYLDQICGDNASLRSRVDAFLGAYDDEPSFLAAPAAGAILTSDMPPIAERPGTQIGPYKLLQQIGEGGFGVVYMAEQMKPVRRKVALKIIKPGMDTKEVVARFEAERQALALMDHPNIAKVLDAGATESGRPYFVMELVKGVPLTEYCDKNHLTAEKRLQLFVTVCHAIQHAHQKGVIHRDLKPSNIMVTLHDGQPVPKVIDFGVSKALSQQLTEKTLFTAYGQMVGTPAYMSPEQAEMSGLDIDTRSDVYSLGVLLYELLTGRTPFDAQRLRSAGYAEMQRIIREEEPPKPSTRLTTMGQESSVVSSNRGSDPKKLGQIIRGDLDWIAMKALDKERNRRYETANDFAADIERFLSDQPVEACPPSASYKFRKFARRNKAGFTVAILAATALVVIAIGSTIAAAKFHSLANHNAELVVDKDAALTAETAAKNEAHRAQEIAETARDREQELREESQRQTKRAEDALAEARQQRERAEANFTLARSAVDEFLNRVTENELLTVPGMQPLRQDLLASAMEFYDEFTKDEANASELLVELASAHYRISVIRGELGQKEESTAANAKSIELFEKLYDDGNESLDVPLGLAKSYFRATRFDDTMKFCQEILKTDPQHPETRSLLAETYNSLALADKNDNDIAAALQYHQKALALREELVRDFQNNPEYLAELGGTVNNLGVLLGRQGKNREALAMFERAVTYSAEAYKKAPQTIRWAEWLGIGLRNVAAKQASFGNQDEALQSYQQLVAVRRKLAFENPAVPSLKGSLCKAWLDLANYQQALGNSAEAGRSFRAAQEILENISQETPDQRFQLAIVYAVLALPIEGSTESPEENQEEHQRYADLAMETITKAVVDGYRDVKTLQSDKHLAALRERDDFQQLVITLEKEIQAERLAATDADTDEQKLADRRQAVDVLRELVGSDAADVRHRRTLASTLHSVGVIEAGLNHFEAAELKFSEAIEIRQDISDETSDDPQALVDLLESRAALGQVYWDTDRLPEAHQLWQPVMDQLETISAAHQDNAAILNVVAGIEREICNRYGRLGLWPLAVAYTDRNVRYGRTTDLRWDAVFAPLILLTQSADAYRQYCRRWDEFSRQSLAGQQSQAFKRVHLVWMCGLVQDPDLAGDELFHMVQDASPDEWIDFCLGAAQYRTGQFDLAAKTLGRWSNSRGITHARLNAMFFLAMSEWSRDRHEAALESLAQADATYRQICANSFVSTPRRGLADPTWSDWWWLVYAHHLRSEASQQILGVPPLDDAWQHLIQARGYWLIGEVERAEAELAAVVVSDDPDILITRARLFDQMGQSERAEPDWQRAVELAGDDPMPWIHRGRWYAERGEQEKADADFAKAASLTPHELNTFLAAGWWVVGPYPSALSEFCPPELDPDPSRPVYTSGPQTGLSDEPVSWRPIVPDNRGRLGLGALFPVEAGSVYALTYVYSPDERTALLRATDSKGMRIWCNRRLVFDTAQQLSKKLEGERIPVALRQGRNELLLKFPLGSARGLRLGDSPLDHALTFSELGLWEEAERLFLKEAHSELTSDASWWREFAKIALLNNHADVYRAECAALFARFRNTTHPWTAFNVVHAAGFANNSLLTDCSEEFSRLRDLAVDGSIVDAPLTAALLSYQQGQFAESAAYLDRIEHPFYVAQGWPLRAILAAQSGDLDAARTWLAKSENFIPDYAHRREFQTHVHTALLLYRDAEHLVTGRSDRADALIEELRAEALQQWEGREPLTAAFDEALRTRSAVWTQVYKGDRTRQASDLHLARGQRLAELGRLDEAEADFDGAVELKPDDPEILAARAVFYAERGDSETSAAQFHAALNIVDSSSSGDFDLRASIDKAIVPFDEVFEHIVELRPDDLQLWIARGRFRAYHGQWEQASADYARQLDLGKFGYNVPIEYACLQQLLGNDAKYREFCTRLWAESRQHTPTSYYLNVYAMSAKSSDQLVHYRNVARDALGVDEPLNAEHVLQRRSTQALVAYRERDYAAALRIIDELPSTRAQDWAVLAMANHELGNEDEASRWLRKLDIWIFLNRKAAPIEAVRFPPSQRTSYWLIAEVLYREAKELIEGQHDGSDVSRKESVVINPGPEEKIQPRGGDGQ